MKKLLLIVNPKAGTRRIGRVLPEVIEIFNRADYEVTVHITAGSGDCTQVVRSRGAQADLIVCAGGDGTFNEAVAGMMESGIDRPLGYIPCGSTNDFAISLKLPTDPVKAAQLIVDGVPLKYDVGLFGDRYFSYVASFGAFTRASYSTPQDIKNALGHTAYLLEGIQEISQIRKEHIRIELDDRIIEDDFLFGAVSNSTSMGGILTLDPRQVDMRDGKFELLLIRAPRDLIEIHECVQAVSKQIYNCAMMTFVSTKKLTVHADASMPWTLDGEREEGREQVVIRCLHQAITLMGKE
jgi:YegS/Rv2252/BmrU family lipid kinase